MNNLKVKTLEKELDVGSGFTITSDSYSASIL